MKKLLTLLVLLVIASAPQLHANELGKRYIKLGNTYRESGNYEKAEEYLTQGMKLLKNDLYWKSTAHEFMGYMYRDMVTSGNYNDNAEYFEALAKENFENALAGFRKAVKQNDGSPSALGAINEQIQRVQSTVNDAGRSGKTSSVNYSNARIVNYDNSKLKSIPTELPVSLENFSAVNNRIKELSGVFAQYKSLKYINLKKNRITSVDNALAGLKNVRVLNLSTNKLKTIPAGIAELKQLEILDLSKNKLKDIPSSITSLKNLKVLDISGNKIPFSQISTLLKSMPNTNIIFDTYELADDEAEDEEAIDGPIQGR